MKYPPISYQEYLKLDQILSAQDLRSKQFDQPAHDEMLFIVVHQVYELWFKLILHEIDSAIATFSQTSVDEKSLGTLVTRLNRIIGIQKILIDQVAIMETMTPMDFLEFRDMLFPASGFQSLQFRLVENKLGLRSEQRLRYNQAPYHESLAKEQIQSALQAEKSPSLFDCIEKWLERTPFLNMQGFDFWENYRIAVLRMFENDRGIVNSHKGLSPQDKGRNLEQIAQSERSFLALFNETDYNEARSEGTWRLSYKAIHAALLIQVYRDEPILHLPFRILTALQDLDENFTSWRYRHALMAKRMLGTKIGTGGSSGYQYLRDATEKHKIFNDLFQLTTFFIPRSLLPQLPAEVQRQLGFFYGTNSN